MAGAMGISKPTLDSLIEEGCPYITKGAKGIPWEFESSVVLEWYIQRNVAKRKLKELDSEKELYRQQKLRADALLAEHKAAKAKSEVATIEEIERQFGELKQEIISKFIAVPDRAAPMVLRLKTEKEIKVTLLEIIDQTLQEIADRAKSAP